MTLRIPSFATLLLAAAFAPAAHALCPAGLAAAAGGATITDIGVVFIETPGTGTYTLDVDTNGSDFDNEIGLFADDGTLLEEADFSLASGMMGAQISREIPEGNYAVAQGGFDTEFADGFDITNGPGGNGELVFNLHIEGVLQFTTTKDTSGIDFFCFTVIPPTPLPTGSPTVSPTAAPTDAPTVSPTNAPSVPPTPAPTDAPTVSPTAFPTASPTVDPGCDAIDFFLFRLICLIKQFNFETFLDFARVF